MSEQPHYSYAHYKNRDVAEGFDALRFGGPIGQYLLATQQALMVDALAPIAGRAILDVGTGTGRAALAFARAGADVTGIDASVEMLDVARRHAAEAGLSALFAPGDAHEIPFPDRAFDAAVSLRVIMHTPNWRQCVTELCRVSRRTVIVDFPAFGSAASIEVLVRRVRHGLGGRVEAYRTIREASVRATLDAAGFDVTRVHRQFVLPINLHKVFNSLGLTLAVERGLAAAGLLRWLGSPVTFVATRREAR